MCGFVVHFDLEGTIVVEADTSVQEGHHAGSADNTQRISMSSYSGNSLPLQRCPSCEPGHMGSGSRKKRISTSVNH